MHTKGRVAVSAGGVVLSALLFMSFAGAAAQGRVIGMTSGGGNKGNGVVDVSPGLGGTRQHQTMTITSPIGGAQCSKNGNPIDCPPGATLTATISNGSSSCASFTTGSSSWNGTAKIAWSGPTGPKAITLKHYTLTFSDGVLYATERGVANGAGIKNGSETGLDAFTLPTGFSCANPGARLTSMDVLGVLKITS
jgi:hypothetical protein